MQRLERDRPAGSAGDRGARQDLLFPLATATGLALTVGVLIPLAPLLLLILLGSLVLLAALLILRPLWFVLAFVFLTPFTHPSLTFGVSSKSAGFGFSLTPYLIALALAYGAFAVWLLLRRQAVPQIRPAFSDLAAVLLVLSNLVSTFGASNTVRAVRPDLNLITLVAAYCMLRVLASVPYRLPALTLVLALSALVVSAIGLLQYALVQYAHLQLPLLPLIKIPEVGARLQGSFDGPNYFGSYAVMALPPILWAARARTSPRQQALFWLSSVLLVGAAFLTFSRFNQILLFAILLLFFSLSWWHMGGWLRVVNVLILAVFAGMAVSLLAGDLATPGLQRRALAALTDPGGDPNLSLRLAQSRR
ncbi:MAG: hypothetical protein ACR2PL_28310, partial [Dehalococcoidia bacterium]